MISVKRHPARFPEKLPEFFIKFLTSPGDIVVDIFSGLSNNFFILSLYSTKTFFEFAFGNSLLLNHQTLLTESFTRIFRLFTHSIGLGNFDGLNQ